MAVWDYAVTFEFDQRAPVTVRGHVTAGKRHTALSRAYRAATKAKPRLNPQSLVVLLQGAEEPSVRDPVQRPALTGRGFGMSRTGKNSSGTRNVREEHH